MIPIRHSPHGDVNRDLREVRVRRSMRNRQWLARVKASQGVILIGGATLAHFRIRVAESHLRSDLLSSFWSLAGILDGADGFYSVPLDLRSEASDVPQKYGVQLCRLGDYDDPVLFPNIAVIEFPSVSDYVRVNVARIQEQ